MRIRLFWHILGTFAILIIFVVGGISVVFAVAFREFSSSSSSSTVAVRQTNWTALAADYYEAHNNSFAGVEARLDALIDADAWGFPSPYGYRVYDLTGNVVAAGGPQDRHNREVGQTPITVDGVTVGTLVVQAAGWSGQFGTRDSQAAVERDDREQNNGERFVGQQIFRAFRWSVLSIGLIAFVLAVFMGRRISAPLAALTRAAQQVALGQPPVKVRSSSIREVATLSRAFNQMAADIARADEVRRNMTADIAHELRTPLTIIKGKLEGILDGVYPGTPQHVEPVLEETNLLERLVDDLRLLSLAEAGQLPLYPEELLVSDLLADVERTFGPVAQAQGVTVGIHAPENLPPVYADGQRMQQVLGNLVANSLRHTPSGGRIELRASTQDQRVQIAVTDTGSGIAPSELEHIFDRFWRGDKARSRHGTGAGLGLAIARQFVEAQGGTISATSEVGVGTTMTVALPIKERSPILYDF